MFFTFIFCERLQNCNWLTCCLADAKYCLYKGAPCLNNWTYDLPYIVWHNIMHHQHDMIKCRFVLKVCLIMSIMLCCILQLFVFAFGVYLYNKHWYGVRLACVNEQFSLRKLWFYCIRMPRSALLMLIFDMFKQVKYALHGQPVPQYIKFYAFMLCFLF